MLTMKGPWLRRIALKQLPQYRVLGRKGVKKLLKPGILFGRNVILPTLEARAGIFNGLRLPVRKDTFIHCHSLAGYY
jgi:hypothetical protein